MHGLSSCAGLTRASIALQQGLAKKMDGRVKPGHDEFQFHNAARQTARRFAVVFHFPRKF
jgi:hypothetical protein